MKPEENEKILIAFRAVRQLHRDISLLLMDTDRFVDKMGWKLFDKQNRCHGETTNIIDASSYWMPMRFFRVYKKDSLPHLLIYISVIIDDEKKEQNFDTPLISVGIIDYGNNTGFDDWDWDYPHAAYWDNSQTNEFGNWYEVDKAKFTTNYKNAEKISYFAHPLTSISSAKTLSEKLLEPLADRLAERTL